MEKASNKRIGSFVLGLLVILLAIFGAITLIMLAGRSVGNLFGDSARRTEYETFLAPVIRNDPDPFDDVSQASQMQLLDCTIWKILQSNLETGQYETVPLADGAGFQIPKADVDAQFAALFGVLDTLEHATIDGGDYVFTYDKTKQAYLVPITAIAPIYIPRVTDIQKKSRSIILTVGYIPASEYLQDEKGNIIQPEPNKYSKITLRTSKDGYFISAIQIS
ncbi:MAG: hypothetical protein LBJ12_09495 [Oscillospiraceae bacterium]|jgi:hypothetical protein|nr:hypothetical protein [Oscillospiraceae bacterium]